jgi:capsular exopolysaccharide synthesis family protein
MPDRLFKPETVKDDLSSAPTEEFFETLERADVYLPVSTEVSPVPPESRIVMYTDPRSAGADRFRLVQIRLTSLQASRKLKSLLITSPLPEDGKSTVTLNLATGLSEEGKRPVLVVEADVHRPTLLEKLGLKGWPGLSESYRRGSDPMLAIRRIEPLGFYLLPAGQPAEDGSRLLQSDFASQLIKGLSSSSFGWILIDSPPSTPVADVVALKAQADATLLVVRAGETPREDIEEATRNLGHDHIIGIILNGVEGFDRTYSKYYGYRRSEAPVKKTKPNVIESLEPSKPGR